MTTLYAAGKKREYVARDHLIECGWTHVMTAAGSKGPADLIMVHPEHGVALVQVGMASKVILPNARRRLLTVADLCSALPIAAIVINMSQPVIRYHLVTMTPASSWPTFDPIYGLDPRRR